MSDYTNNNNGEANSNNMNISENEIITFPDSNLEDVICEVINKPEGNIYLVDVIDITVLEAN